MAAREALIERRDRDRQADPEADPEASHIILTHTNDEGRALKVAARERVREAGDLGPEVEVSVERGERGLAPRDRVMFRQNVLGLGVKNGTLGTIMDVDRRATSGTIPRWRASFLL